MEFVTKQVRPGVTILEMTGSIRVGPSCQQIEAALGEVIRQGSIWVVFDLSGVSYIDSSGVGSFVRALIELKKLGGTLRLAGVKGMIQGVLKLMQIDRAIEIFPTGRDAAQDLPLASKT